MPAGSLSIARDLCVWESQTRHAAAGFKKSDLRRELRRLDVFKPYWSEFGRVVLAKAFASRKLTDEAMAIAAGTTGPLGDLLRLEVMPPQGAPAASAHEQLSLLPSPLEGFSQEVLDRLKTVQISRAEQERINSRVQTIAIREMLANRTSAADGSDLCA